MSGHERVGQPGQFLDVGPQLAGTQGAVQPDDERSGMADRVPERLHRVTGEGPAAGVGDRAGDPQRYADAQLVEDRLDREDGRLGVEDVEDRLDHEQVRAADEQAAGRLGIRHGQLLERYGARGGIGHVRRDGRGLVGRPEGAGDEAGPGGVGGFGGVGRFPGDSGRLDVDLVRDAFHPVVGLSDARRGEGIGRDDVGPGRQIGVVDGPDHIRPGQAQQVRVAANVAWVIAETLAAEVGFGQAVALDERPRGSVEHENPLLKQRPQQGQALISRPGFARRRFCMRLRRRDRGDLFGRCRVGVSLGGPASFQAQCTERTERRPKRRGAVVAGAGHPAGGLKVPVAGSYSSAEGR